MISMLFTALALFCGYRAWQFVYDYETRVLALQAFLAHRFGAGPNDREIAERVAREFFRFDLGAAAANCLFALVAL